jgi:transposase
MPSTHSHRAFLARLVEEGPIPAIHGVVRWRACDQIMRLHEEFGLSVSDDTIYRALKDLGFSHVSVRPKAYKQDADAMAAFKKTLPPTWRKSAQHCRLAHP